MSFNINAKLNNLIAQNEAIQKDASQKQPSLKQSATVTGVPVIDENNNIRQIISYYPIVSQVYNNNSANSSDVKNNQIQLSFSKDFSNLTHYYTSTDSDARYMPLFTVESPLNLQSQILSIDLNSYATTFYVDTIISNLLGGVGANLDTLHELSKALNDDSHLVLL